MKSFTLLFIALLLLATATQRCASEEESTQECYGCEHQTIFSSEEAEQCLSGTETMRQNCEEAFKDSDISKIEGVTRDQFFVTCEKSVAKVLDKVVYVFKGCRFVPKAAEHCLASTQLLKKDHCNKLQVEQAAEYKKKIEECASQGRSIQEFFSELVKVESGLEVCWCTGNLCNGSKSLHTTGWRDATISLLIIAIGSLVCSMLSR